MKPDARGGDYQVVEFESCHPPRNLTWRGDAPLADSETLKAQLEWLRKEPQGEAWEALCAVLAAVSTRKEKNWLEAHETFDSLEEELENIQAPKSKKSPKRKDAIRKLIAEECSSACGFFSHYLVRTNASLRVAFAPRASKLLPASVIITTRSPLWEALHGLDDNGPLRGEAASRQWLKASGRQFAFQLANFGVDEKSIKCRESAAELKPDTKLRDLLRSRKMVVQLEVVAALAPRDVSKKEGLSDIVKAELTRVMHEAKTRGEAVVFCLGSDHAHSLAEKVYLREPIGSYGLRCGYLRWRESADVPWARERAWSD